MIPISEKKLLLLQLGDHLRQGGEAWESAKAKAFTANAWFIPEFVDLAAASIADAYLSNEALEDLIQTYRLDENPPAPKKVGIVMAGNIPMVGFHDLLCVFLSGHISMVKLSSKDEVLMTYIIQQLIRMDERVSQWIIISEFLKNCDAYIATGSNNSSRYFEYYFSKYPHIIRRNRTSIALLNGSETQEDLERLADDVYQYFGLGCRNVTQLLVTRDYDFVPLLDAFRKWNHLADHNKFKNNYDYQLAAHLLNKRFYMTNGSILLVENDSPFAPVSQVHYRFYDRKEEADSLLKNNDDVQCIVGQNHLSFGSAQLPGICQFADGVDTVAFLKSL